MRREARLATLTAAVLLGGGLCMPQATAAGLGDLIDAQQGRHEARVDARQDRREDRQEAREARRDCLGEGPGCRREVRHERFEAGQERLKERFD